MAGCNAAYKPSSCWSLRSSTLMSVLDSMSAILCLTVFWFVGYIYLSIESKAPQYEKWSLLALFKGRQERRGKGLLVDIYFMFGLSGRCGGAGMYGRRSGKGSGDSWLQ
ncbi:hypothetical protein An16g05720 [Aspergillus niger]|uniref:Uncharacterized protein n=2 Tax=Aspergillus niger TaxID=5061 RepID=A2R838_ASPNC|nr:hypothetical protein An16g05720 [Aspergillus niger]CAK46912.1 hypothetical protein An16g05720 [Aspergillus niger]